MERGVKDGQEMPVIPLRFASPTQFSLQSSTSKPMPVLSLTFSLLSLLFPLTSGQIYTGPEDPRLQVAFTLETPSNGLSTTPDGRIFLVYQHVDNTGPNPQIVEFNTTTNTSTPYPNQAWNNHTSGADPGTHFVSANAQRIGPDGKLYVIDSGQPGGSGATQAGRGPVAFPYGPKVVQIDVTTAEVTRIYYFGNSTNSASHLDDIRFHNSTSKAYLTDAGSAGLIVLDLAAGETRRVLSNDPSTGSYIPVSAEGSFLRSSDGSPSYTYADQLEVSPDGKWFYHQSSAGSMSRISTEALDAAFSNSSMNQNEVLDAWVEPFAHTPSTGGTAIDAQGNIYNSDTDSQRVIKIAPNGTVS
jgi:hypothetical protein